MAVIRDTAFVAWLKLHPEERAECKQCDGKGYEACDQCDESQDDCWYCEGKVMLCNGCTGTGIACYNRFAVKREREERLLREWNEGLKQKSPVSSMAVVAADSQVALGYSSETGS